MGISKGGFSEKAVSFSPEECSEISSWGWEGGCRDWRIPMNSFWLNLPQPLQTVSVSPSLERRRIGLHLPCRLCSGVVHTWCKLVWLSQIWGSSVCGGGEHRGQKTGRGLSWVTTVRWACVLRERRRGWDWGDGHCRVQRRSQAQVGRTWALPPHCYWEPSAPHTFN